MSPRRSRLTSLSPEESILYYVEKFFHESGNTEFPTIRQVAKALVMRQQYVWDLCDGNEDFILTTYFATPEPKIGDWYVETL